MARTPEGMARCKISNSNWQKTHRAERTDYNRRLLKSRPGLKATYNKTALLKGKAAFENDEKKRAIEKKCSLCKETKPASAFYLSNTNKDGLHGWCKECSDKKTKENGRKRLGLTPEEYESLFNRQGRVCAICGAAVSGKKDFHLDHDHVTGKIRGILCRHCNSILGMAKDDIVILQKAITYLKKEHQ